VIVNPQPHQATGPTLDGTRPQAHTGPEMTVYFVSSMNLKEQHELIIRNYPKEWTPVDDCDYWVGDGRIQYFLLIQL